MWLRECPYRRLKPDHHRISTTPAPSDPPQGPSTTRAPVAPPSTQYGYPVLTELSPITLAEVTRIEIQGSPVNGGGPIIPLRTLSPAADRELVERLLAAYGKALLDPGAGFPTREGFRWLYSLAIYCRGEREVLIDVPAEGDRVVVAEVVGGLPAAGQESNPPQTYGTAQTTFARER